MTDLAPLRSGAAIAALFPAPAAVAAPPVRTFEDVERHLKAHGPKYLLQALRTLQSHCRMAPLSTLAADLGWFLDEFPKSSRQNPMPRPDLGQGVAPYKKWHADIRRALELASGARGARTVRDARADGWADLLAAIKAQTEDGGLIHPGSAGTVKRLADLGRRQSFEPWDLATPDIVATIEDGLAHHTERAPIRSALGLLADHRFIPEIAALLPPADQPLVFLPTRRDLWRLPDHVDAVVRQLVAAASLSIDPTNGKARPRVAQKTIDGYLAAMRYHLRTLRRCAPEPEFGYAPPADLAAVNDVVGLFGVDHISATLRWTERHDHLPETLEARSAYEYYKDIERILKHAGALPEGLPAVLVGSHYMQDARALCDGMTPEMQEWCEALVTDPAKERAFHAMHRTLMRTAEDLLARARHEGRLGVGRIIVFDEDVAEHTNLNRLHGATRKDADEARPVVVLMHCACPCRSRTGAWSSRRLGTRRALQTSGGVQASREGSNHWSRWRRSDQLSCPAGGYRMEPVTQGWPTTQSRNGGRLTSIQHPSRTIITELIDRSSIRASG